MRRFELIEGASSKFWEAQVEGQTLTVRFGRIGTAGQTKAKAFGSDAAARKEHDALVKEKTGKGYREVAAAPGAMVAAALVAPAPAAEPPPTPAPAPAKPAVDPAPPAGDIDWPRGRFEWTDELLALLPAVRGVHAPPLPDAQVLLARPPVFRADAHGYLGKQFAEIALMLGRGWTAWDPATAEQQLQPASLARADHEHWLQLCAQCLAARAEASLPSTVHHYNRSDALRWLACVGVALHGLPFIVGVGLEMVRKTWQPQSYVHLRVLNSLIATLADIVATTDDAAHADVIALLDEQAGSTPADRLLRAMLCPHRADWVLQAVHDHADGDHLLLRHAVMPPEELAACLRRVQPYWSMVESALLLQVRLHDVAAFGLVAELLRRAQDRDTREKLTAFALRLPTPELPVVLAGLIDHKETRQALEQLAQRYPAAVLKCVAEHALASRSRLAEGWAVRLALRDPAALAQALPALQAADRVRFGALLAQLQRDEAAPERLPPLLRNPPWLGKARAAVLPTLALPVLPRQPHIDWPADELARAQAYTVRAFQLHTRGDPVTHHLEAMQITAAGAARIRAGQPLQEGDVQPTRSWFYGVSPEVVLVFPDAAGLALWNSYPARYWHAWDGPEAPIKALLARHGLAALPGLVAYANAQPELGLPIARAVDSPLLVPAALHALRNLKKAKAPAAAWLRAHADTALAVALPMAFGDSKAARDDGQFGVRWLAANGFEAAARQAAAAIGGDAPAALQALLDADPLLVLPTRMPRLPGFFVAAALRRPELRDGGSALPLAAVEHIGTMLAISRLDAPYAGLAIVKDVCTPASLAEFAWDLFEAWNAAASPARESWAFAALGLLGDDETARRLAPRIREWPGESQHQRAVAGLDLLAAIGTDVALMHLNGIAGKVKFKALQERAREKIAQVAASRGFSAEELADRLVPDLGLDERGSLVLDFGPRRLHVGFDEALKPFVRDEQGVRLKDLPKPLKSDDAALAAAATERWKDLKKDAKAIASLQVMRLEMSMVARRRWRAADFRLFFLQHPLMRHLAARVIWAQYDAQGAVQRCLRVAEDWTLADADDQATELADDAVVGIVHLLEMPAADQAAFGQVLADYEIVQPFRQLGRETFALTDAERAGSELTRFADKAVSSGSVLGLANRGWQRGQAQDAGWVGWFSKRMGDDLQVDLELDPGMAVGDPSFEPRQHIARIVLRSSGTWDKDGLQPFARLHPIDASEVLRDAALLAPYKDT